MFFSTKPEDKTLFQEVHARRRTAGDTKSENGTNPEHRSEVASRPEPAVREENTARPVPTRAWPGMYLGEGPYAW